MSKKYRSQKRGSAIKSRRGLVSAVVILLLFASWLSRNTQLNHETNSTSENPVSRIETSSGSSSSLTSSQVAAEAPQIEGKSTNTAVIQANQLVNQTYQAKQLIAVNQNQPTFTTKELSLARGSWQQYEDLDNLNRVQGATAMLGQDIMPTAKRERLYVRPTGWHNRQIKINGKNNLLYNRCHLIGYQLTGQNNNLKNLMTGTRSLNDPAMTFYENAIAKYLKTTNHHVLYQVRPVFKGTELVARGVHMMAASVEDEEISFNVYIFNVQPNYTINYQDGTSKNA